MLAVMDEQPTLSRLMGGQMDNPRPTSSSFNMQLARAANGHAWEQLAMQPDEEDAYLRELAGVDDLTQAVSLQAVINTATSTVSHLGAKLPSLQELNLNGSIIESVRDLGIGFQGLQVLWLSRCGLPSLDGMSSLPCLRELYAAFNDVCDLQPVQACTLLEVLDLEGNCITEADMVHHLALCPNLQCLSLSGNPLAASLTYARAVHAVLGSSLQTLDDQPLADLVAEEEHKGTGGTGSAPSACTPAAGSAQGAAEAASPSQGEPGAAGEGAGGSQAGEAELVTAGIKHARVGVDSHEFREMEVTLFLEAAAGIDFSMGQGVACSDNGAPFLTLINSPGLGLGGAPGTAASGASGGAGPSPRMLLGGGVAAGGGLLPGATAGWLRALRSCATGTLAGLRSSREGFSAVPLSPSASTHSTHSGGHSPVVSRPPSGTRDSTGTAAGRVAIAAASSPAWGSAGSSRPFSAWVGTATVGAGELGRPTTGASAPPTAGGGGLYWRKHRLQPGGSGPAGGPNRGGPALLEPPEEAEEGGGGSSSLTYGGEAIGGSLARDLRRRRKGAALHAAGAGRGLMRSFSNPSTSMPRAPQLVACSTQGLLEELRRWKIDSADKTLQAEEGTELEAPLWAGAGESMKEQASVDILDLGVSAAGLSPQALSLSDDVAVGTVLAVGAVESVGSQNSLQGQGSTQQATQFELPRGGQQGAGTAGRGEAGKSQDFQGQGHSSATQSPEVQGQGQQGDGGAARGGEQLLPPRYPSFAPPLGGDEGSRALLHPVSSRRRPAGFDSTPPQLPSLPPPSIRLQGEGGARGQDGQRVSRTSWRTVLSKVLNDVSALQQDLPLSKQGPGQPPHGGMGPPPNGGTGLAPVRVPSARCTADQGSSTGLRSVGSGLLQTSCSAPWEVDLACVNPRPRPREDVDTSEDEEDTY